MVVGQPQAAKWLWSVADADYDYTVNAIEYPVSGDLTAQHSGYRCLREYERWALRMTRRTVVAGGRLPRADGVQLVQVQCTDCPWGLKVQGWDAGAGRLAQRHADARGHAVLRTVVR